MWWHPCAMLEHSLMSATTNIKVHCRSMSCLSSAECCTVAGRFNCASLDGTCKAFAPTPVQATSPIQCRSLKQRQRNETTLIWIDWINLPTTWEGRLPWIEDTSKCQLINYGIHWTTDLLVLYHPRLRTGLRINYTSSKRRCGWSIVDIDYRSLK